MELKKQIGLFFGSFNPVHVGHMIIAEYMHSQTELDEIWMIVSPHNPLKKRNTLAKDYDRLHLLNLAIGENINIKASDIEFELPRPSYTVDTLAFMKEKYPHHNFNLIMGGDNINTLHKWKNYEILLRDYQIYVYQREGYEITQFLEHEHVHILGDVPLMHISSSYIRGLLKNKKSIKYLVPSDVERYIERNNMYS